MRRDRSGIIRSIAELAITAGLLALFWVVMLASLKVGYWLTLLLAIPTAGFLVRIFILQHDCGHGASFRRRVTNDWVGRILGVFTLTPYDVWRRDHATHHANSGNLGRRGIGDLKTLTVREYVERSRFGKWAYRLYRHPAIIFGVGPAYVFILENRLPVGQMRLGALGQHDGDQCGERRARGRDDVAGRRRTVFDGSPAGGASGFFHWCVAVLHPAPVRRDPLGP